MIQSFNNQGTEDIFNDKNTKETRKICPQNLWPVGFKKIGPTRLGQIP
jgi:proteic killer suppression protein